MRRSAGLLVLVIVLVGCDTLPEVYFDFSPNIFDGVDIRKIAVFQPTPSEFIGGVLVYPGRIALAEEMCFPINEYALAEVGDKTAAIHDILVSDDGFSIAVNGEPYTLRGGNLYWETGLTLMWQERPTAQGTPETISWSDITYCFNTFNLPVGSYNVEVEVRTVSGIKHAYGWTFLIFEEPRSFTFNGADNRKIQMSLDTTSEYLYDIVVEAPSQSHPEAVCFTLNQRQLQEAGTTLAMFYQHFTSAAGIFVAVNGQPYTLRGGNLYWESSLADYYLRGEAEENIPETMGYSDLRYCLPTADLPIGSYQVEVALRTLSSVMHTHTWTFTIFEETADTQGDAS